MECYFVHYHNILIGLCKQNPSQLHTFIHSSWNANITVSILGLLHLNTVQSVSRGSIAL